MTTSHLNTKDVNDNCFKSFFYQIDIKVHNQDILVKKSYFFRSMILSGGLKGCRIKIILKDYKNFIIRQCN